MSEEHRESGRQIATTAQTAWSAPTDPVEKLLDELRRDPELNRVHFTGFLNDVGYILERDGFGAVQVYLLDRAERRDLAPQARFVLDRVLPRLRACPLVQSRRALGRYVIKILRALQQRREFHDQRTGVPRGSRSPGTSPGRRRS